MTVDDYNNIVITQTKSYAECKQEGGGDYTRWYLAGLNSQFYWVHENDTGIKVQPVEPPKYDVAALKEANILQVEMLRRNIKNNQYLLPNENYEQLTEPQVDWDDLIRQANP
jgi:hypothetical protein